MTENQEFKSVLNMYEELLNKLTKRNKKLKSWVKNRK